MREATTSDWLNVSSAESQRTPIEFNGNAFWFSHLLIGPRMMHCAFKGGRGEEGKKFGEGVDKWSLSHNYMCDMNHTPSCDVVRFNFWPTLTPIEQKSVFCSAAEEEGENTLEPYLDVAFHDASRNHE